MIRKITLSAIFTLLSVAIVFAQTGNGSLKGTIKDSKSGEPLPFVNVVLLSNGNQVTGGASDFDGKYYIKPITPGKYDVIVKFIGYQNKRVNDVVINSNKISFLDIKLTSSDVELEEFEVISYTVPLIDKDGGASGGTVTRDDISKMAARSATAVAATVGGVQETDAGGTTIRGARSEGTYYYIDGIKVRGSSNLPKSAIQEVSVITGGVPASYGDATGGIISITTRGTSSKFFGGIEAISSGVKLGDKVVGLDSYGHNIIDAYVSGPLLMEKDSTGKKTRPLLGFFLAANYSAFVDQRPTFDGALQIKDDVRQSLLENPLSLNPSGTGAAYNVSYLRENDFERVKTKPNNNRNNLSLQAKIDVTTTPTIDLTFGGNVDYNRRRTNPWSNALMNTDNNGLLTDLTWRAFARFTQRFSDTNTEGDEKTDGLKNVFYSVMVDYSKENLRDESNKHFDNVFNYGHVGKFDIYSERNYTFVPEDGETGYFDHDGFVDTLVTFTPSSTNADLAAVTTQFFDIFGGQTGGEDFQTYLQSRNALLNGGVPQSVYNIWTNIGSVYNVFAVTDNSQFRISATGSADLGDHAISLGFEYEQRRDSRFEVGGLQGARDLWTLMRRLQNFHIEELDTDNPSIEFLGTFPYYTYDRLYSASDQTFFDRSLREKLGLPINGLDYLNIDALDPELFSLDMFSADELLNDGVNYVTYYGYDHTGKKISGRPSFDDFFNETDRNGNLTRAIGAFEPIYIAGYIMDKFAFDDIIFNVGVRVDRFDANQPVLKDPFLLRSARTVAEVNNLGTHPSNIGDDYVVYVNDLDNPSAILGYRNGETWYNASGAIISDPNVLASSSGRLAPYLLDQNSELSSDVFEDYKPQINVMPRIAFSFPISDEALFFAHYDILTQRPESNIRLNPIHYYTIDRGNGNRVIANNPNLRPSRTIDYELGFQQVLSKTSSLKISAFYRELRDQIALRNVLGAYPGAYRTYDNIDFGTVKGLTISYDLRKTGNVRMNASYTLQFADGTGSSATSQLNLINSDQPNLRTVFPVNYDQRHVINAVVDYRYGSGGDYNGPVWFGKQIFANMGANFTLNASSGTPYSQQEIPTQDASLLNQSRILEGSVNGSRLPWQLRTNVQIDRDVMLKFGEGEKQKTANLNVFLLVNNLLNTRNINNVYRFTGNAQDDGFLASAFAQDAIAGQLDPISYVDYYNMKIANPYNFVTPRTIQLGLRVDF